jgi:hypothetical protein
MAGVYDRKMFRDAAPMAAGGLMIKALEQSGAIQPVMEQLGITNLAGAVPGPNMAALFMQMYGRAPSPEELQSFMASNPVRMADGGATFPDLSGDGKITQKDILMGRGVSMADGGMVPPMAEDMPVMTPDQEMQMAQAAQSLPPEVLQMAGNELQAVSGELADEEVAREVNDVVASSLYNVDMAGDFKDLMNVVWEQDADVNFYRDKLAQVVGPEDAANTPVSVLTLVQPTLQLAEVDKGVGMLMQEELAEMGDAGGGIADLGSAGAVADGIARETGALVDAVGNMGQGAGQGGMDQMMTEAVMQGAGPMGQEMA